MAASSTTQKMTVAVRSLIQRFCVAFNCGVMLRNKGEEVGITADQITMTTSGLPTWDGDKEMSIYKTTIRQMETALAWLRETTAVMFSDLSPEDQEAVRGQVRGTQMDFMAQVMEVATP